MTFPINWAILHESKQLFISFSKIIKRKLVYLKTTETQTFFNVQQKVDLFVKWQFCVYHLEKCFPKNIISYRKTNNNFLSIQNGQQIILWNSVKLLNWGILKYNKFMKIHWFIAKTSTLPTVKTIKHFSTKNRF